jgi:nucleoside-diphosphate-sugar epimerase
MNVALIGCDGFVGSAFARLFQRSSLQFTPVNRKSYNENRGKVWDIVIDAASSSKKFIADERPLIDMNASVGHSLNVLVDFPSQKHVLISSVDVYNKLDNPVATSEGTEIQPQLLPNYGFHKYLSEMLVLRHAPNALIFRLAGMVGPRLKKNPVFDIINKLPLRIHPDSKYQFLHTDVIADIVWELIPKLPAGEIVNVCGKGLISPYQIAEITEADLDLSQVSGPPRIVDISIEKLSRLINIPCTFETILRFAGNNQLWS